MTQTSNSCSQNAGCSYCNYLQNLIEKTTRLTQIKIMGIMK